MFVFDVHVIFFSFFKFLGLSVVVSVFFYRCYLLLMIPRIILFNFLKWIHNRLNTMRTGILSYVAYARESGV